MSGRRAVVRLQEQPPETATVLDTTTDGCGIASVAGKRVFVNGAICGEVVTFRRTRRRRNYDEAELVAVLTPSAERVTPPCEHFGVCGGCALQHVSPQAQLQLKESVLLENLRRIGSVAPQRRLPPVMGPAWGYRRRARLAVRDVPGKGRVLVGFRERLKPYVTDMRHCHTLHPAAARLIGPLSELIGALSLRARLPQVEVAVAENATVLVLRVLAEPTPGDFAALRRFRDVHGVRLYLQRTEPAMPVPLDPDRDGGELWYELAGLDLRITFGATDFIQVNGDINRKLVGLALDLLAPEPEMRVLDLFCGVGNFTLPLARRARQVIGIDIEPDVLARARHNAALNDISNVEFHAADLGQAPSAAWARDHYDLVVLDPPRTGAAALMAPIAGMQPQRILYISCHSGTLARDAGVLGGPHGYRLIAAGALDMFPGTRHIESIALFGRRA